MIENLDLSKGDANDPRARSGIGLGRQQTWIRGRANRTNHERAEAVKDGQPPDESPSCFWDVAPRGDSLPRGEGDELRGGDKGETRLDKSGPKGEKATGTPAHHVLFNRTVLLPVPEPNGLVVWRSTAHDDQADEDETYDGEELDAGKPELCLTKDLDGEDVQRQVDAQDDGDPDRCRDGCLPIVEDDGTRPTEVIRSISIQPESDTREHTHEASAATSTA